MESHSQFPEWPFSISKHKTATAAAATTNRTNKPRVDLVVTWGKWLAPNLPLENLIQFLEVWTVIVCLFFIQPYSRVNFKCSSPRHLLHFFFYKPNESIINEWKTMSSLNSLEDFDFWCHLKTRAGAPESTCFCFDQEIGFLKVI